MSADFEELRSRCTAACGGGGGGGVKESNQHSKFTSEPLHIHTGNDNKTGQSPQSNLSLNTMLSDYHQYSNTVFSPSENRLHELVEYEVSCGAVCILYICIDEAVKLHRLRWLGHVFRFHP
ncbi:unnamed protein product [Trichobilharzia regenti]|nr:unnamed protein product [Trichobilharzia regenti]